MPATKPDSITKLSAAETNPSGWPSGSEKRVGMWVIVISTSIPPRSASISHRRDDERAGGGAAAGAAAATAWVPRACAEGPREITRVAKEGRLQSFEAYRN